MSKTQLQMNNTRLDSLIDTLKEKSVGGEDLSEEISICNGHLDELEETIETLPNAGGGSVVETCDVTITTPSNTIVIYTQSVDGQPVYNDSYGMQHSLVNVACDTAIVVSDLGQIINYTFTANNAEKVSDAFSGNNQIWVFRALSAGSATIDIVTARYD